MPCTVRMYLRMPGGLGSIFCRSHATWTSTVRVDGIDATAPGGGSALRVLRMRIFSGRRGTEGTEQASTRRNGEILAGTGNDSRRSKFSVSSCLSVEGSFRSLRPLRVPRKPSIHHEEVRQRQGG